MWCRQKYGLADISYHIQVRKLGSAMVNLKKTGFGSLVVIAGIIAGSVGAFAASILNSDSTAQTLVVTEGSTKQQVTVQPGEKVTLCPSGCFVTFPNGDREALTGNEAITILNGGGTHK